MQPDNSTPSRQGTGTKNNKAINTVADSDIPEENRALEGVNEGRTEGALPKTSTEPRMHGTENGRRNVERGLHS